MSCQVQCCLCYWAETWETLKTRGNGFASLNRKMEIPSVRRSLGRWALALTELRWGQTKQKNGVEKEGCWYFGLQYQPILLYLSLPHQLRVPSVQQAGVHLNRAACSSYRGDPSSDKRHYLKNNSTQAFLSSLQTPKWDEQVVRLKKWREHFFFFFAYQALHLVDSIWRDSVLCIQKLLEQTFRSLLCLVV